MIHGIQVKQIKARLGEVAVEFQVLAQRWPIDRDRREMEQALLEALRSVAEVAIQLDRCPINFYDKRLARAIHAAYLSVFVPLQVLIPKLKEQEGEHEELLSTERVSYALELLLDLLEPARQHADRVLGCDVQATLVSDQDSTKTQRGLKRT